MPPLGEQLQILALHHPDQVYALWPNIGLPRDVDHDAFRRQLRDRLRELARTEPERLDALQTQVHRSLMRLLAIDDRTETARHAGADRPD